MIYTQVVLHLDRHSFAFQLSCLQWNIMGLYRRLTDCPRLVCAVTIRKQTLCTVCGHHRIHCDTTVACYRTSCGLDRPRRRQPRQL